MEKFNKLFDHTLLKPNATSKQIIKLCEEAKKYDFASVCVNPDFVSLAAKQLEDSDVKVCTVIGFPLGANLAEIKWMEATLALSQGADEIDMVINVSDAKEHNFAKIEEEISQIRKATKNHILKVIFETCLLDDNEIIEICKICAKEKVDFVKTSTGFSTGGATIEAVSLMKKTLNGACQIKASGGIHTKEEVLSFVKAGATRIGCSSSVNIMEEK
ncbi:MAG TPA: deoxyribose-phosphate aldolase [Firmicutes bacterium]|nr:deoxyribose-phosphate aldolase [Bacillota bacterium]HBM70411.1 deoxyribose-phosphate aldolase [Bacillota bacterium]